METLESLHANTLNYNHIKKYGISEKDLEDVNWTIAIIETSRRKNTPWTGDIIECSSPQDGMIRYPNGHLDQQIHTEFASICVQGATPFVFHNGREITSFSCSGGYWTREQELEMYTYQGQKEKMFCQWGSCGMAHSGAIYFRAIVNVWRLIKEGIY